MIPQNKEQNLLLFSSFLYIFSLSVSRWNAVYSISFCLLLGILFYLFVRKKDICKIYFPNKKFNLIYWPFFISLILSSIILGDMLSIKKAFNFFYWSFPFFLLYFSMQYEFRSEYVVNAFAMALWVTSGKAVQQYITADTMIRVTGFFGGPNDLADILTLTMTFLFSITFGMRKEFSKWTRINSYGAFALGLVALMMTGSRAGMIAFIAGAVISFQMYLYVSKYKLSAFRKGAFIGIIIAVVIFFVGGMWVTQNRQIRQGYDSERVKLLMSAYEMWDDHKVLGVGLTNWGKEYHETYIRPDAKEPNLDIPHNVPAYFFSSAGTIAGITYLLYSLGIIGYMYKEMRKNPVNPYIYGFVWAAISVFIHGVVDSGITTNNVLRLYSGLLGITMASILHHKKKEKYE